MPSANRVRNFVFTLNNPPEDETTLPVRNDPRVRYLVYGRETAPTTGTRHLQGYVELSSQLSFAVARELVPGAHLEARRGTARQAQEYCKKDGDWHEQGECSNPGKRKDIDLAAEMVREGCSTRELAEAHPSTFVRYHKGFAALRAALAPVRSWVPDVKVYWGGTETGKTRRAYAESTAPFVWMPQMGKWFDGYEGQKDVIFDEFRGQLPFGMLLNLLDRYECRVEYKGGSCQFSPEQIIITSPKHPRDWYTDLTDNDKYEQLERRINKGIVHLLPPLANPGV